MTGDEIALGNYQARLATDVLRQAFDDGPERVAALWDVRILLDVV